MKTTDIKTYSNQLQEKLTVKIESIAIENMEIISRSSKCLLAVNEILGELKEFVYKYEFQSKQEEIDFFKEIKPVFLSQYYYYKTIIDMKMNEPLWNPKKTKTYYRAQLRKSFNVIKYHIEFFTYCHLGQSYLDEQYFSRTNNRFKSQEIDSKFSTGYDSILAIILANKMLKDYVENLISTQGPDCRGNSGITWTAKKAYLVELIYALHKAEAFNNGNAELKQIATLFENHFNVTLGNFYRHFQEIGIRKSGRTTFIDLLKKKLEQRFDEDI